MTKAELSDELAKATGLTKQESAGIVETVFECITAALVKGNKVELRGFGGFKVRQHRSRTARNPKVGTAVYVPAKKVPRFKTSKQLRNLLNTPVHPVSEPWFTPAVEGLGRAHGQPVRPGQGESAPDGDSRDVPPWASQTRPA